MKKDVKAFVMFATIGLMGALCASCSNGRDARKAERLMNENMELTNKVAELRDSIAAMPEAIDVNNYDQVFISLRSYANEADEVGTPRSDLRVEKLQPEVGAARWYVFDGADVYEVDSVAAMAVKYGDQEGLYGVRLFRDGNVWHVLYQ